MRLAKLIATTIISATALMATAVQAEIVTFSGIPNGTISQSTYVEGAVTTTAVNPGAYFFGFPSAGQLHLDVGSGNGAYDFTYASGLFDLVGFDVSFASGGAVGTFSVFDAANALIGTSTFSAATTGARAISLTGVSRLRLVDTGSHFSIDNLQLNATNGAVPEPATWAMMILGMGVVGYAMRRRIKVSEVNFTNHVRAIAAS